MVLFIGVGEVRFRGLPQIRKASFFKEIVPSIRLIRLMLGNFFIAGGLEPSAPGLLNLWGFCKVLQWIYRMPLIPVVFL